MEEKLKKVMKEIIYRAVKLGRRKKRTIYISKTPGGEKIPVEELNPATIDGRKRLEEYLGKGRLYSIVSNLGSSSEKNRINWRVVNLPLLQRVIYLLLTFFCMLMKGCELKNRFYRAMGVQIGRNVEIMQFSWLDHFRPELISISDNTLLGAFTKLTVHAYEGDGMFRVGYIQIGKNCKIASGAAMGFIRIEDDVRVLPNTTLSPYFTYLKSGSVVGFDPPAKKTPLESREMQNPDLH
ncbi:MAG: hypothetical protein PHF84_02005 [bacterium]|nr:hypothetical protein [bacterium]